jgi:hypothetical protein
MNIPMIAVEVNLSMANGKIVPLGYDNVNYFTYIWVYENSFGTVINKGNNKITELRTILQRESQNA